MIASQFHPSASAYCPRRLLRIIPSIGYAFLIRLLSVLLDALSNPEIVQILCNGFLYWEAYEPFIDKDLPDSETDFYVWLNQQKK